MKFIFYYIFIISLINIYAVIPTWNVKTSAIDLLGEKDEHTYNIDHRNNWYASSDNLDKTLKRVNGEITHQNTFTMYGLNWNGIKYQHIVDFEAIESFYADTNSKTYIPLVCPRGTYNVFKITSTTEMSQFTYSTSDWAFKDKFDLKCFFHRSLGGNFLVYYLMNGESYLLQLKDSTLQTVSKYRFDFDEIFDFKLLNRENFVVAESNPYPFIGLVKKEDNLRLIGTGLDFTKESQTIDSYKDIFKLKKYTQAYFHVYHYNNDFYYFTYNNIYDFTSGYSTNSIPTIEKAHYNEISDVTFKNNDKSPFEFENDVEILLMENIFNYKYVYYKVKDKVTNIIYHGIVDIKLNKVMFNTDEEVKLFIPYITFIDENGGYEHSNSMLMITQSSAYRVCAIKNGDDCLEECPSGQKIIYDVDGNKCGLQCETGKITLIPEEVCVSECNTSLFVSNGTHCGLCRDMDNSNNYKFVNGSECLSEIPENAVIYNKNLSLLVCDKGYILKNDMCITHCFNTCKTCYDYSENESEQKCKSCIEGYYLVDEINYNCEPILPSTIPIIPSTIPNIPSTISYYNICTYQYYLTYNCSFENLDNFGILSKLKTEMLRTYPYNGINVEIKALAGFAFQLSNTLSQLVDEDSPFSKIDLGECERSIKERYGLDPNISLIFFKFENIESSQRDRIIKYEVYNPLNYDLLNISICEDTKIQITISLGLSDEIIEIIKNILEQGYNPFDENDKFYREICTPYDSENGTDVLLDDREEYIYSTIQSEMTCPSGCEMSSYSLDNKYINCECNIDNTGIVELDLNNINAKNIEDSFLSTLKNTNYKVMRCYNLVFNFKIFCHNAGSIITLIFFISYVVFMVFYAIKDISPLKVSISKFIFEERKNNEINSNLVNPSILQINNKAKSEKDEKISKLKDKNQSKSEKGSYPPKKNNNTMGKTKNKKLNNIKLIDLDSDKKKKERMISQGDLKSVKSGRVRKIPINNDNHSDTYLKTKDKLINQNKTSKLNDNREKKVKFKDDEIDTTFIIKEKNFDDYELNNMGYNDACEYDKRSCLRTYWSILKREHYVIFTFISRNDHNIFYIKIERFFIVICTEITMNGLFFVHETMYKKQNGGLSFCQKIPQIIFSLLVSHAVEIILCYLSMTDITYYEIKELPKQEKYHEKVFDLLDNRKRKLIGFFVFTFLFFLFHWYFISAFCAVYQNTQLIYLRDSAISILVSLVDPFIIYGINCLLRILSLSALCKKKLCCIYKLSDIFPLF